MIMGQVTPLSLGSAKCTQQRGVADSFVCLHVDGENVVRLLVQISVYNCVVCTL